MAYLGQVDRKASNVQVFNVTSSTSATHDIGWTPPSEQTLIVTINGVKQHTNAFSFSGSTLTLGAALVATDELEVVGINDIGNSLTPVDNSVTTSKLGDNSVTLAKMAGGTDGNLITYDASGDPAYVATGAATNVLTSNGAGAAPTFQAAAAGGLTQASQWRLTTSFDNNATLISNLEEVDTAGYGRLGSAMTVDGAGSFTFPETGYWYVNFVCTYDSETYSASPSGGSLSTSINTGGAWTQQTGEQGMTYLGYYNHSNSTFIFDVENTTTHLVRFSFTAQGATDTCIGSSTMNKTYMTFMRLGDT